MVGISAAEKLYLPGHVYVQGCTCLPILCIIFQHFEIATLFMGIFGKQSILYLLGKCPNLGEVSARNMIFLYKKRFEIYYKEGGIRPVPNSIVSRDG